MRFATALAFSSPSQYLPIARACDEAGYWAVSVSDHIVQPQHITSPYPYTADGSPRFEAFTDWLDPWVAIGAMGAVTERIRFFTNIFVLPARNPFVAAKMISTAATLTEGRVGLGIGVGWMREEFELLGQAFERRGRRTDEMVELLRSLWAGGWVEHHGEFYDVPPVEMSPPPPAPVPIYVGGISDIALRRAARLGDGWVSDLHSTADLASMIATTNAYRAEYGTADRPFEFICSCSDAARPDDMRRLADVGVTVLLTSPWVYRYGFTDDLQRRLDGVRWFAETIIEPLNADPS